MKRLVLLFALLAVSTAHAAIAVEQALTAGSSCQNCSIAFTTKNDTAHSTVVLMIMPGSQARSLSTPPTWSEAGSGAVTAVYSAAAIGTTTYAWVYIIDNIAGGTKGSASWSWDASTTSNALLAEISGLTTSALGPASTWASATSGTTATSNAITTTVANAILVCVVGVGSGRTGTEGAGYTMFYTTSARPIGEYQIVAATQSGVTASMTWTSATSWGAGLFALYTTAPPVTYRRVSGGWR